MIGPILPAMRALLIAAGLVALPAVPAAAQAPACRPGPTALVLSGGGAKGIAHVGVLLALDSLGIRPDLVVGTSMGAIVGGMYASGMPAREIDSAVRALPLTGLFESSRPRSPASWNGRPAMVRWAQGEGGFALQAAAVDEPQANAILTAALLRGNLRARGDFDSLPIPFRAVATDLQAWHPVVLGRGDLAQAVRASIAIPVLFSPERLDGRVLVDGGLTANIPVGVARDLGAARVIVSDVTDRRAETDSIQGDTPLEVVDRLFAVLFEQPLAPLGPGDLLVRPAVEGYRALDFTPERVEALVALGRRAADSTLSGWDCPPAPPRPLPPLPRRIAGLHSARVEDTPLLQRLLEVSPSQDLDAAGLARGILALRGSDLYRSVWLNPGGTRDSVQLAPVTRRSPRRQAGLGLSYDNELGGQVWFGVVERRGRSGDIELGGLLTLARFHREAELSARLFTSLTRYAVTPVARIHFSNDVIRKFTVPGVEDTRDDVQESRLVFGLERPFFNGWQVALGVESLLWQAPAVDREYAAGGRFLVIRRRDPEARRVFGDLQWNTGWFRAEAEVAARLTAGPLVAEPRLRLAAGHDLPVHRTFVLGGDDGFPGLNRYEVRGDREAIASIQSSYRVVGPASLRLLVATGRVATGGMVLGSEGWRTGARVGIGLDSPIGPLQFEHGWSTGGRRASWVRIGRWF